MERRLDSLGVTPAWRVGATVRRATGPWTPAVHAVLAHVAPLGVAPQVLGTDEQGREVLTWIEGTNTDASCDDAVVVEVAELARRLRTSLADHTPADDSVWRTGPHDKGWPVAHNDLAPWNVVVRDGHVAGLIDWDLCGPRPPLDDFAYAAWRFVPLMPGAGLRWPERLRLMADAYELAGSERTGFAAAVIARIARASASVAWAVAHGDPGLTKIWSDGAFAATQAESIAWVHAHRSEMASALGT